jgi:HSF-type DNA-binding
MMNSYRLNQQGQVADPAFLADRASPSALTANDPASRIPSQESSHGKTQQSRNKQNSNSKEASSKASLFPLALYGLLEDVETNGSASIVSWRPSGTAFKVEKRDEFVNDILPRYFKQTKFKSFVRQLNLWGFTCIDKGQDKGSCKYTSCNNLF